MIRLYHCPEARSMRVLWLLEEMGLDFELEELDFSMASLRRPEYLEISPLGRVPCLVDGTTRIFESGAIIQYLCETYDDVSQPCGRLHRGPGDPERVEWLQWLHYAETIAVHGASLVQQNVFIRPEDRSPVVRKLESRRLEKSLEVIDARLEGRDWLLASGFSAVDVAVGYSVHLGQQFVSLDPAPRVAAYYARLCDRPAFQRSRGSRKQGRSAST
ncbi:MAG: glutathione S-transferase family protein [Pseudomonadales bacterium]|jgi:glutathione S-transferase|nr:glutathione S-transferase family protein [Pseudomonadales bacterium]